MPSLDTNSANALLREGRGVRGEVGIRTADRSPMKITKSHCATKNLTPEVTLRAPTWKCLDRRSAPGTGRPTCCRSGCRARGGADDECGGLGGGDRDRCGWRRGLRGPPLPSLRPLVLFPFSLSLSLSRSPRRIRTWELQKAMPQAQPLGQTCAYILYIQVGAPRFSASTL